MKRITRADIEDMRCAGCDRSVLAEAEAWLLVCERADELIAKISAAFAGVALGNGIGLRESDGIDGYMGTEALRQLRETDEKLDWQRIDPELLTYCNAAPSFLDAEGMRFHTPAFIVAELRGQYHVGFVDRLIDNSLGAPEFIDLLSPDQRHAIMSCISFYGSIYGFDFDPNEISNALTRYSNAGLPKN